ncbi:ammonium transporter [Paraglaciecola hydrolytica]|uniref:Diguanylate cyclase n=1 Tax=Paraglaciecola hydrolytica TaxID=1799789 RepID=A0A136A1I9_9ALTE|nr:ammonium transporter [Paraglaciecola hydrolytica]KXI29102.1 diguanylate cyclase [Paraglaciecola hydrolytica]
MEYAWLLMCSMLVFLMQAGFLCLESGKIRSKNSINVAAKNIADFVVAAILFWLFGFAFMFGDSLNGIIGTSAFYFGANNSPYEISFFIFQMMFCGTAATILSGAVAERMSFRGYIFATLVMTSIIYPVSGHWAWASFYNVNNQGWLQQAGFIDFAGSTVVHSVGGWVALAAVIIIGPRIGRFNSPTPFPVGSNIPMSVLGTLLIWLGWFGFNGGSTMMFNSQVPGILLNTSLAAAWGGVTAACCHYYYHRYVDVTFIMNGVIAGLVAITASCHAVSPQSSAIIGIVAGVVLVSGTSFIIRIKIDDALGVVATHLFAGIWGTLAVALFSDLNILATGLSRIEQFGAQLLGVVTIGVYTFGLSYLLLRLINYFEPLRVSKENELVGMNISEHKASTELIELLTNMHHQEIKGEFSHPVPVEPFTEVGQIANQYNSVIQRVNDEISKRDSAIINFRTSEKRKGAILDSAMDSILTIDFNGNIIEFNQSAERTFGNLRKQVAGENFMKLFIRPQDHKKFATSLQYKFSSPNGLLINRRNSLILMRYSNDEFPAEITITGAQFDSDLQNEYTLHVRDVTREVKLQSKLKQLAYSDPLTGLYNRTFLLDKLTRTLKRQREQQGTVAIYFMDLDKFKQINDTLGHKAGDELLNEVARRLSKSTRNTDVIARWGGDEFLVMISGKISVDLIRAKGQEFLQVMREPLTLAGREIKIPISIGIAITLDLEINAEQLIQQADIAMYSAKQLGRDNFQFFKPEMAHKALRQFNFEQEIRHAINQSDQFYMVYQPKVNELKEVISFESLIRWQHPVEGLIMPGEFIPLTEESDIIIQLGEKVIEMTFAQLQHWRDAGYTLLPVSINISGRHLISGNIVPFIKAQLEKFTLDGSLIELEITESVLLSDIEQCIAVMFEFKKLNITLSIDDFGTGYSSLNYLKRLPIDILKIDRSFVDECTTSVEDGQIVTTIINLAQNLGLRTVAEGVEIEEQFEFLEKTGCNLFQGYYFYKPLHAHNVINLLIKR